MRTANADLCGSPRVDLERQRRKQMGRPLNKRYFGYTADSNGDLTGEGHLSAVVKVGTNAVSQTGIILSQRSETKFKVSDNPDESSGNIGNCVLVDKVTPADDEMVVQGFTTNGEAINIRKFHNRTVLDFNDNRYTWEIEDDSTSNILRLTAI